MRGLPHIYTSTSRNLSIYLLNHIRPKNASRIEAMVKYIVTVATSLIIVAKGPDAIAGSKLAFLNRKGKPVEIKTAEIMLRNMDSPTISPSVEFCQPTKAIVESSNPHANARESATANSLTK